MNVNEGHSIFGSILCFALFSFINTSKSAFVIFILASPKPCFNSESYCVHYPEKKKDFSTNFLIVL